MAPAGQDPIGEAEQLAPLVEALLRLSGSPRTPIEDHFRGLLPLAAGGGLVAVIVLARVWIGLLGGPYSHRVVLFRWSRGASGNERLKLVSIVGV
jgi:hypothetical protein